MNAASSKIIPSNDGLQTVVPTVSTPETANFASIPFPCPPIRTTLGCVLIEAERVRQISEEGYSEAHDDGHTSSEMARAAKVLLKCAMRQLRGAPMAHVMSLHFGWPWSRRSFKVSPDPLRQLVKAGALIAAEIDRLERKHLREVEAERLRLEAAVERSLLPERELHIEYEVEGHPHASEEGNCPFLGSERGRRIATHEEAAAAHAAGAR